MATYLECIQLPSIPRGHWKDISNHTKFIIYLGNKLDYTKPEDWYKISTNAIKEFGGSGFIGKYYEGSAIQIVKAVFPDYDYKDWLFTYAPQGYWTNINNVKLYMTWLYEKKGFTNMEDWYKLRESDLFQYSGRGLYARYNCTILYILQAVYPDYEWFPWLFTITPNGIWSDVANHTKYMNWLGKKIGILKLDDWYKYSANIVMENYGTGLISNKYGGSFSKLLKVAYPDYEFILYKFNQAPWGYWNDSNNINNYLTDLYKHKGFTNTSDWYSITYKDFLDFYGNGLLDRYSSCYKKVLMEHIDYEWDETKFVKAGYSMKACDFLDRLSIAISIKISHKLNDKEHKVSGTNYYADGYIAKYNNRQIIVEYNGCCYHGCPTCYPNSSTKTFFSNKTYKECLDYTIRRKESIQALGIIVISIWEHEDLPTLDLKEWFETQVSEFIPIIEVSISDHNSFILPTRNRIEYRCDLCNYTAFLPSNLTKHLKTNSHIEKAKKKKEEIHIKNKIKKCMLCSYETKWKSNLNRHMKVTHPIDTITHE